MMESSAPTNQQKQFLSSPLHPYDSWKHTDKVSHSTKTCVEPRDTCNL